MLFLDRETTKKKSSTCHKCQNIKQKEIIAKDTGWFGMYPHGNWQIASKRREDKNRTYKQIIQSFQCR